MNSNIFILLFFLSSFIYVRSQTCCSGGIPLSNNLGLQTLDKGTLQIGLTYDYNHLNTLKSGTTNLDDNSRLRNTHSILLNSGYSISDRFSAEVLFSWVNQRRKISQFDNENLDQTSGIGDAVVLLKYNFPKLLGENSVFNIGITLNSDLQPGSNSWDIIYYTLASKNFNFRPSANIFLKTIYRNTGANNEYLTNRQYKFGNEIQSEIGISDQFTLSKTLFSPSLSFKYRSAKKDKIDEFELENTGGDWLFLIPNFSINLLPSIVFNTKAEIPLYSNVGGTQLTPSYRITSGFLINITSKKSLLN